MAKVTPGFKLYLYQLLSREVGIGKQTLLPQVEDVLRADDILVGDLECATMQELVEACPDFMKLTVFKKGRVYATVLRVDEWDQMLAEEPEKPAAKKPGGGAAGGHKSWKKKKATKKSFKPVKPGKKRRDCEAAEAVARAEREAAEAAAAAERAEREAAEAAAAAERAEREAAEAAERAEREAAAATADAAAQGETSADVELADVQTVGVSAQAVEPAAKAELVSATAEQLENAPREPSVAAQADEPTAEAEHEAVATAEKLDEARREASTPAPESKPTAAESPAAADKRADAGQAAEADVPAPADEPEAAAPAPAPAPESTIKLTITYDPYEDMERELERQRRENPPAPERTPAPQPEHKPKPSLSPIPLGDLPQDFGAEVSCKDALLRALYQLLPYDVDPMAVLDEDWRMARSTGSLSGSRNRVTFPLRYLHEDGTPITATLRKITKSTFGKRWGLTLVDGDDGTGESHLSLGFEGLPAADEGAWSDLAASTSSDVSNSPMRVLTEHVVIGTWESFLGGLAAIAAPERWNYPTEGVGRTSRYGILREYIATTFLRALRQERVAKAADGSFAAFDTGLTTPLGDDIYACLLPHAGDIPWKFAGFATAGSGELGVRMISTLSELPQTPSYLQSLDDVVCDRSRMVILDTEAILGRQLGRLPHAFLLERLEGNAEARELLAQTGPLTQEDLTRLARIIKSDAGSYRRLRRALDDATGQAMRAAQQSYRLVAPVFDPTDNRTKLLLPLRLVDEQTTDCALVLDLQPSGAYRAAAIMPLARAYACARVVSREQPSWLAPKRVLG